MKTLVLIGFVCVLAAVGLIQPTSAEVVPVYVKLGEELVLLPNTSSVTLPITGILWLHGQNKVTEWDTAFGEEVDYYGTYRNRTDLNKETAKLVVRNLLERDNGVYSVTINGLGQSTSFETKFIVDVPKPRVILKPLTCSVDHSRDCTLFCDGGELTETTGPVTYHWMKIVGDKSEWLNDITQTLTITNNEETNKIQKFACEMKNPVSALQSDPSDNKLYVPPPTPPLWIIPVVLFLILALVFGFLLGVKFSQTCRDMLPDTISERLKKCLCIQDYRPTSSKEPDEKGNGVPLEDATGEGRNKEVATAVATDDPADKDEGLTEVLTDNQAVKENGETKDKPAGSDDKESGGAPGQPAGPAEN